MCFHERKFYFRFVIYSWNDLHLLRCSFYNLSISEQRIKREEIMRCTWNVRERIMTIIPIHQCNAGMTPCPKPRSNDKGAAPRFAMASPSIWCRISLRAAIFSPPLCLSLSLFLPVSSRPRSLGQGWCSSLSKRTRERPTLPSFPLDPRVHLTIRYSHESILFDEYFSKRSLLLEYNSVY